MSGNNTSNLRPGFCWSDNDKPQVSGEGQAILADVLHRLYLSQTLTVRAEVQFAAAEDFLCPEIMILIMVS